MSHNVRLIILIIPFAVFSNKILSQNKGTCSAPFDTLTTYLSYAAADNNYSNKQITWTTEQTATVYTFSIFNSGPAGCVGFDMSNTSTSTNAGASGCLGNSDRSIKVFKVGSACNWADPSEGTMVQGNNSSSYTNPEFSGLTPNTNYIAVTQINATTNCAVNGQYLTYYQTNCLTSSNNSGTFNNKIDFRIYPNPASDFINIEALNLNESKINIQLVNVLGEKVLETLINENNKAIDVKNWAAGIYYCRIIINDVNFETKKIIINR